VQPYAIDSIILKWHLGTIEIFLELIMSVKVRKPFAFSNHIAIA